jgi:hypothetical protein
MEMGRLVLAAIVLACLGLATLAATASRGAPAPPPAHRIVFK